MLEMQESNELLDQPELLQQRMRSKGYLLFRDLIDVESLLALRRDITDILVKNGWIVAGDSQLEAIAARPAVREMEESEGFFDVYDEVQKLESFYSLPHHPELMKAMRAVRGESVFPHPLSIARLIFPENNETTTPPHQDFPNNQGSKDLTAAWIPLSDCPRSLGGIAVLEGSNQFDEVLPLAYHLGAGGRQAVLPDKYQELQWVGTDFRMGDVLMFPALTVHKALDNHSENKMRLSVDFRYQLEGEHLTETVLQPHFNRFSWEDVYKNWQSEQYQYYWKRKHYVIDEWNLDYHRLADDHMAEALRQENKYKKSRLERAAKWKAQNQ